MGLDLVPMGKPKPGYEQRFAALYALLVEDKFPKTNFWNKLFGKKAPSKEALLQEWHSIQISPYETIKAPRVGRDPAADDWLLHKYHERNPEISLEAFIASQRDMYIVELATELDGVSVYLGSVYDNAAFRGQCLNECAELIGETLVNEAWQSKTAEETLDYGNRLLEIAENVAGRYSLTHLGRQRMPPDSEENSIESQLHIVYSLAKWLIFYGKNGHGYEADF